MGKNKDMDRESNIEYEFVEAELIDQHVASEKLKKAHDFYEKLRKKITNWAEEKGGDKGRKVAEILLLAPDLFMLLVRLIQDPRTPTKQKVLVGVGIAYFFSPLDFMPEAILGPIGYLDDIVLAAFIINQILNSNRHLVLENWSGRGDVLAVVQDISAKAEDLVGRRIYQQLQRLFKQKNM